MAGTTGVIHTHRHKKGLKIFWNGSTNMTKYLKLLVTLWTIMVSCASGVAVAATINVPANYSTIQAAIDASVNGDEVVVDPNTYYEAINFLGKAITLRSASGDPNDTIIDGIGPDGVAALVVRIANRARVLQSGYLYHYAFAMLIGVAAFVSWLMIGSAG